MVGEVVSQSLNDRWAAEKNVYNMYGPTEATCGATIKHLEQNKPVTIGAPNPSTRIYILDGRQRILPRGAIGEIYLAGVQVSNGYIGNESETNLRFMTDSVLWELGERMYRTGDYGSWNDIGEINYIGRSDRQIKLRGFRLDLNDLETRILEAVPLATAVVVTSIGSLLVAVLKSDSLEISTVNALLAAKLPTYAIPQKLAVVKKIETTAAGKVNYKAMENFKFPSTVNLARSMNHTEQKVALAWRETLGASKFTDTEITVASNYLDLGGTSIQVLLLSHRLSADFQRIVPIKMIFGMTTLAQLAKDIDTLELETVDMAIKPLGKHELSPIEREWFIKYQKTQISSCFNVSFACSLGIDVGLLEAEEIVEHCPLPTSHSSMPVSDNRKWNTKKRIHPTRTTGRKDLSP